jgi:hypothetical protein
MSNAAQEEADRLFGQKEHHTSHPEDRLDTDSLSQHSSEPKEDYRSDDDDDDEDTLHHQSNQMAATANYHIPNTRFNANTGPKGVIADAQSFNRAKRSAFRKTLNSFANALTSRPAPRPPVAASSHGSGSEQDSDEEEFMRQWRRNRIEELTERNNANVRRKSPSQRTWGTVEDVDATGYLDAIEKVKDDVVVVVCIYDPESNTSFEVEDILGTIAYKHTTTRFVKMHHEIAEMTEVVVPALLAYRGGEVFATISDAKPEGLETTLRRHGVLK